MKKLQIIALSLLGLCASCSSGTDSGLKKPVSGDALEGGGSSSATDSGLTKQELRDIYKVVARYTTNKIETVLIPLPDCVEVTTETQEIFNLRHYPTGWELTDRTKF